jgi:hypothetical protein
MMFRSPNLAPPPDPEPAGAWPAGPPAAGGDAGREDIASPEDTEAS